MRGRSATEKGCDEMAVMPASEIDAVAASEKDAITASEMGEMR